MVSEQNDKNAVQEYYERYAGAEVASARWFVATIILSLVCLVLAGVVAKAMHAARHERLVILQSNADGSLDRTQYVDVGTYVPGDKEIKHFAYVYVVAAYSRVRATLAADFTNHLAFLPQAERDRLNAVARQTKWITAFEQGNDDEVLIRITNVRMGGSEVSPRHISVDFEKQFKQNGVAQVDKTENWTVDLAYVVTPEGDVDSDLVPINPLGLIIVDVRESKGLGLVGG